MELGVLPEQLQRSFMIAGSLPQIPTFFISAKEHIKSLSCSCLLLTLVYTGQKIEESTEKDKLQTLRPDQK